MAPVDLCDQGAPWTTSTPSAIQLIRGFAMDAPRRASSGHPGTAMALAPSAHVLFSRIMRHDPADPHWPDRDRFVLSCGHASILLYSMLYLSGYGLELDDLEAFRQWAATPRATPRRHHTTGRRGDHRPARPGLRQLGRHGHRRALPARPVRRRRGRPPHLRDRRRRRPHGGREPRGRVAGRPPRPRPARRRVRRQPHHHRRPHRTGLQRRLRQALRGLRLARDPPGRGRQRPRRPRGRAAAGPWPSRTARRCWCCAATSAGRRPSSPTTAKAHGDPFPRRRDRRTKEILGLPPDEHVLRARPTWSAPTATPAARARRRARSAWQQRLDALGRATGASGTPAGRAPAPARLGGQAAHVRAGREAGHPPGRSRRPSTPRSTCLPGLLSGAADLTGNTGTKLDGAEQQSASTPGGRQIHFGIREYGMGVGYERHGHARRHRARRRHVLRVQRLLRPPFAWRRCRKAKVVFVFTHDSVGLGEDGPTHQPIEHLAVAAGHARPAA